MPQDPSAPYRRRRRLIALLAIVAVVAIGYFSVTTLIGRASRKLAAQMVAEYLPKVERKTGLHISVGRIEPGLSGHSVVREIRVQADNGGDPVPLLYLPRLEVLHDIDWWHRSLKLEGVRLLKPAFTVELYKNGATNLPALLQRLSAAPLEGTGLTNHSLVAAAPEVSVLIEQGTLQVLDRRKPQASKPLVELFEIDGTAKLHMRDKSLKLRGTARQTGSGGKVFLDSRATRTQLTALVRMANFELRQLAHYLPGSIQLSEHTRCNGRLQVNKPRELDKWFLSLNADAELLNLFHKRLAGQPLDRWQVGLEGQMIASPDKRELTAESIRVHSGRAYFSIRDTVLRVPADGPFLLETTLAAEGVPVQDVLDGLPEQLIPAIKGTQVRGKLNLQAKLVLDTDEIKRSHLEIHGDVDDFAPVSVPPRCDVRLIKSSQYKHLARKHGLLQKTIILDPAGDDFVPLGSISPYLTGAVRTCEDGAFFGHHGFLLNHINDSIRRDLRDKRFARGASTITMQLVKNLFLSEEKTIGRKLQEGMLTWWIEREVSKERMFEVYLNIIEWGPKIYGIGPASRHYFHVHASKLGPLQSAFLASIIANPVRYYYMKSRGAITDGWRSNLAFIMSKMRDRGTITEEEYQTALDNNFEVAFPE
ncbi:MAG TPA: biosynthetic peptidoglycan transglycosylase [bacterium]|nr:biosynthetic peptidoglycan transglycosylase [bacterium]